MSQTTPNAKRLKEIAKENSHAQQKSIICCGKGTGKARTRSLIAHKGKKK